MSSMSNIAIATPPSRISPGLLTAYLPRRLRDAKVRSLPVSEPDSALACALEACLVRVYWMDGPLSLTAWMLSASASI
jgi:hypothetical protein